MTNKKNVVVDLLWAFRNFKKMNKDSGDLWTLRLAPYMLAMDIGVSMCCEQADFVPRGARLQRAADSDSGNAWVVYIV